MATFGVVVLTATPPGQAGDANASLTKVDGREALLRSVELFLNRDPVKQVQLVIADAGFESAKEKFGPHLSFSGVKMLKAGPRWIDQLSASAAALDPEVTHVLVHDAARPAVPGSDIELLMTEAQTHPLVTLTAPLRSTLVEIDPGSSPMAIHLPTSYLQLLTPTIYTRALFLETAAKKTEPHASRYTLVKGSPLNARVGSAADAPLLKAILGLLPKPKIKAANSPFEEAQW